jgi:hypothetical protein
MNVRFLQDSVSTFTWGSEEYQENPQDNWNADQDQNLAPPEYVS